MFEPLGKLIRLEYGQALPSEQRTGYGYPVFGSNGVVGYHEQPLVTGPGIVVGRKGSVGKAAWSEVGFWPIDTTYYVESQGCDISWAYRVLDWLPLQDLDTSTGVPGLNRNDVYEISVFVPCKKEQEVIARTLDNLDIQIQKTEALIAKLEKVKEGLLHDLLTRGIDEHGRLRPRPEQAPELYKESPLGLIPREWEARPFGDSIEKVIDYRGRTPKKLGMDWGGGDILALSANNVQPGAIDTSREAYFGGSRLYRRWMASGDVKRGDVLLTMEAPLGNIAKIPDDAKYILSQRVIALRFNRDFALNDFIFWVMQSADFQKAMKERSTGSTAAGIQRAELFKLSLKLPPLEEQKLISIKISSLGTRLRNELTALGKLREEKSGLMDDLLTGHVRVTPLLDQAQATTPA
ncbi:restriction endonuclease subunit S [Halomonas sp. 328]|uniref:restriction endonuclease subunit S n=1 Tax=Halomonas sp. 328 TaxID=2776704 RepID=UPI0018A70DC9|nr:restriction endonuclease subunit S [Halomonas sp. 328]MBF8221457.1 restriction endonuclease subunit S [Halomonas sp. 328]